TQRARVISEDLSDSGFAPIAPTAPVGTVHLPGLFLSNSVKGAWGVRQVGLGELRVDLRRAEATMTQQSLDHEDADAVFQHVRGEGMAERADRNALEDPRTEPRPLESLLDCALRERFAGDVAFEQKQLGSVGTPADPQCLERPLRKHDVAVLPSL